MRIISILAMGILLSPFAYAKTFRFAGIVVPQFPVDERLESSDPRLRVGPQGLTVEILSAWARAGYNAQLEHLFRDYAVKMRCLPQGSSAGKAGEVFAGRVSRNQSNFLTSLAEASWYGKIFQPNPADCRISAGVNKIYLLQYVTFVTRLVGSKALAPTRGNLVELNYSSPGFGLIPLIVDGLGVYDLMVAVPGKNGPIYIGKTWFGTYVNGIQANSFRVGSEQTNWYFLDFNSHSAD